MPRYTVNQNYRAERSDATLTVFGPWAAGDVVEVDEADAEWVNADSAGTLSPAPAKAKPAAKKAKADPEPSAPDATQSTGTASGLTKGG